LNRSLHYFNSEYLSRLVHLTFYQSLAGQPHFDQLILINDGQDLSDMDLDTMIYQKSTNFQKSVLIVGCAAAIGEGRKQEYGVQWSADYAGRGNRAAEYNQFILSELIPWLHDEFPLNSQLDTCIAGWSLGGLSAMDIAWHAPQRFNKAGVFSGSFWWRHPEKILDDTHHRLMHHRIKHTTVRPELKFWFQAGTEDEKADRNQNGIIDVIDDTLDLMDELHAKGFDKEQDMKFHLVEGGKHDVQTWKSVMPVFLDWVLT